MRALLRVTLALGLMSGPAWAAGCKVAKVAELPMTVFRNHIYVPVGVNETQGQFVLDTGAFHSMLNNAFAQSAGVQLDRNQPDLLAQGVGGHESETLRAGRIRMLTLGEINIPDREMPMSEFSTAAPGGGRAAGLLGADLLNLLDLELDFQNSKVIFWRLFDCTELAPVGWTGDYASIPLRRQASKHLKIPIWLDGAVVQAVLDTGADGLVIDRATALAAGVTDADLAHDPVRAGMGVGGRAAGRLHHFKLLLIGKDVYRDVAAFVTDGSGDTPVLVGLPFLLGHRVWFSYGTETLFLQSAAK